MPSFNLLDVQMVEVGRFVRIHLVDVVLGLLIPQPETVTVIQILPEFFRGLAGYV